MPSHDSKSHKTIVTGGAGFIGSHLTERLLNDGHAVTVIDNLASGTVENLNAVKDNPKLKIHVADVANYNDLKAEFEGADWVFHLAGIADVVPSIQEPIRYHRANVDGTVAVLEASRNAGVSRFVYAASSSCYGLPDEIPTPETAEIRPMYPYALSKNLGEQCVMHWNKVYQLPTVALRLFNVYGLRSRTAGTYGAVFGVFLAQKMAGKPLTVVGDGNQTRSFCYVDDLIDGLIKLMDSSDNFTGPINIGNPEECTILELCEKIIHLTGSESTLVYKSTIADLVSSSKRLTHIEIAFIRSILKIAYALLM